MLYFDPSGMMKERSSAHSPQAILFAWNNDTHVAINVNQIMEPIAEKIKSENREAESSSGNWVIDIKTYTFW